MTPIHIAVTGSMTPKTAVVVAPTIRVAYVIVTSEPIVGTSPKPKTSPKAFKSGIGAIPSGNECIKNKTLPTANVIKLSNDPEILPMRLLQFTITR